MRFLENTVTFDPILQAQIMWLKDHTLMCDPLQKKDSQFDKKIGWVFSFKFGLKIIGRPEKSDRKI